MKKLRFITSLVTFCSLAVLLTAGFWQFWQTHAGHAATSADANTLYRLDNDGSIWSYQGGTSWQELGINAKTTQIVAGNNGSLFQRRSDGTIWKYTGTPLSGWLEISNNSANEEMYLAPGGTDLTLYVLRSDETLWQYTGTPLSGWNEIETAANSSEQLLGYNDNLYRYDFANTSIEWLHWIVARTHSGSIYKYYGWSTVLPAPNVANPACGGFCAVATGPDGQIYAYLHTFTDNTPTLQFYNGSTWSTMPLLPAPYTNCGLLVSPAGTLYQIVSNVNNGSTDPHQVYEYVAGSWQVLSASTTGTYQLATGSHGEVYREDNDGSIWKYSNGTSWTQIGSTNAPLGGNAMIISNEGNTNVGFSELGHC